MFGRKNVKILLNMALGAAALTLSGCPITGGGSDTVGGTVTGLIGSGLVLQLNGGDSLSFSSSATFVFGTKLDNGAAYSVTVMTQPSNPTQTCTVRNGSGAINSASVSNVIVSCTQTGQFAYVANRVSNSISGFAIDQANGQLVPLSGSPFGTGAGPVSIAIDPTDAFAFVANNSAQTIASYALNATTGALTPSGSPLSAGTNAEAVAVDPTGSYVFAANAQGANQVATFIITPASGALTVSSTTAAGSLPIAATIDPSGQFLYAVNFNSNDVSAYTLSATGALTPVAGSPFAVGGQPHAIAID